MSHRSYHDKIKIHLMSHRSCFNEIKIHLISHSSCHDEIKIHLMSQRSCHDEIKIQSLLNKVNFSAIFHKGGKFCDFLFVLLHTKLLKRDLL